MLPTKQHHCCQSTGSCTHQVMFMPHSEKQNHRSVKAALLCSFFISDENKSISVSFDLPHFLTDTFRMLTSILVWWLPTPQQGPKIPWGTASVQVQPAAEKQSKAGMCPQPPCFSLAVPPVAVQASGCRVTDAQAALGVRRAPAHLQQVLQGRGCSLEWWHCSPASSYRPAQLRQQLSSLPCSLLTTEFI